MRRPDRVRDGVVEVAELGGFVAAREATRQIPAPDEFAQRRGRGVAGFGWRVAGVVHLAQPGLCCRIPPSSAVGSTAAPST